jgi:hypothetical protein
MSSDKRQCYLVRTDGDDLYQARLELDRAEDLLAVDLAPLRDGGVVLDATECTEPVFLVCTHGRHDQCCSIRGNQVSRVACTQRGVDAWECSHIGGDRFAANLVCFPHGLYYGRVGPDDVTRLMDDYTGGSLSLDHYRGRCCHVFPVQAAEYFARHETGVTEIEGLSLSDWERTSDGIVAAFSLADGGRIRIEVRVSKGAKERLTCGASGTDPIPLYELTSCSAAPA